MSSLFKTTDGNYCQKTFSLLGCHSFDHRGPHLIDVLLFCLSSDDGCCYGAARLDDPELLLVPDGVELAVVLMAPYDQVQIHVQFLVQEALGDVLLVSSVCSEMGRKILKFWSFWSILCHQNSRLSDIQKLMSARAEGQLTRTKLQVGIHLNITECAQHTISECIRTK